MKISCHTGTYGTLPDDIHILYQTCECIITGSSLYQTLRTAKAQLARGNVTYLYKNALNTKVGVATMSYNNGGTK